jgi:hypothetical protein
LGCCVWAQGMTTLGCVGLRVGHVVLTVATTATAATAATASVAVLLAVSTSAQAGVDIMGVALAAGRSSVAEAIQSEPLESPSQLLVAAEREAAAMHAPGRHRRSSSMLRALDESGVVLPILQLTMPVVVEKWDLDAVRGLASQLSPEVSTVRCDAMCCCLLFCVSASH